MLRALKNKVKEKQQITPDVAVVANARISNLKSGNLVLNMTKSKTVT